MQLKVLDLEEDKTLSIYQNPECQQLFTIYEDYYQKQGFTPPWVSYLIMKESQVVGSCGFVSAPINGNVEIAYWTFKAFEGQGIASFAVKALIEIAQKTDPKLIITAKTMPTPNASTKILEKNGFEMTQIVQDHEIGDAWLWELKPG